MKRIFIKLLLICFSLILAFAIAEIGLRILNLPPEADKKYQRQDIAWMEKNVVLNSAGYRDKEYPQERQAGTFRIYALGDSYTYGWLVDNPNDSYPEILENKYAKASKKVEVINAGNPGFSIPEMVNRFISEGKYYYPDLIVVGINDDEANFSKTYEQPQDNTYNKIVKSFRLYQISLGSFFKKTAEETNHDYVLKIYTDSSSTEWENTAKSLLELKEEANKINAQVALVLFPHIHPNKPYDEYDYLPFNQKYKEFAQENGLIFVDPLEDFLQYRDKDKLVINPYDPHPTAEMNTIVAESFYKQFNFEEFINNHQPYLPEIKHTVLSQNNKALGSYQLIKNIQSNIEGYPWVYFETKFDKNIQNFPLKDKSSRNSNIYLDNLQTALAFTHSGLPGATILYHIYPKDPGKILIPKNIYGFEVIGISNIYSLEILDNGTIKGEYISPAEIIKKDEGIEISYYSDIDYHVFRINLKVGVRQLDINKDGIAESTTKTYLLKTTQDAKNQTVTLPLVNKISSWAQFTNQEGNSYSYAFVNNKLTKIKEIKIETDKITLIFDIPIEQGQQIEFPIMAQYDLAPDETIDIDYE